ncbi:hypothetical protein FNV43_RR21883 [Rhamnella rubrinervis]|uniref:Uncharacterized protein n=1 Tax=Rhamnella rubrinervis TaxID=2594499 RepID=A0A8K0E0V7_9ROSA|nr:hypothetical protein FNV43_RR21883 [Rhamnella rubrinervis]
MAEIDKELYFRSAEGIFASADKSDVVWSRSIRVSDMFHVYNRFYGTRIFHLTFLRDDVRSKILHVEKLEHQPSDDHSSCRILARSPTLQCRDPRACDNEKKLLGLISDGGEYHRRGSSMTVPLMCGLCSEGKEMGPHAIMIVDTMVFNTSIF